MSEKPDYVANFVLPPKTEIKHIGNHWYLYERINFYDPTVKRTRKKSGKILGSITENGFVPSKARVNTRKPTDVVEVGAVNFVYQRTDWMRERLQKHFPDLWEIIYVIVIIRTIHEKALKRLQLHYDDSILSYLFPGLSFTPSKITNFLSTLGRMRSSIRSFMQEMVAEHGQFILCDGHRLLSASHTLENAEYGYDSKKRFKPQTNLLYLFSIGENGGYPVYYKQYMGSTPDVIAFSDILAECSAYATNCTIIGDKGVPSDFNFELIDEAGLKYIMPLRRGNQYVKGQVPISPSLYDRTFCYHDRAIRVKKIPEDGFVIYLYLDMDLYAEEIADNAKRTEKKNNTNQLAMEKEYARRQKGKGRLSDEQLKNLQPIDPQETEKEEIGTITIKTTRTDLDEIEIYTMYKRRQEIEQFFKTYGDTLEFDASYMQNNYSQEAWLFLNHLSSIIGVRIIEEIASIGESKNISLEDLTETLLKIKAEKYEDEWRVTPVKKKVQTLCKRMGIDPNDLTNLKL